MIDGPDEMQLRFMIKESGVDAQNNPGGIRILEDLGEHDAAALALTESGGTIEAKTCAH